MTDQPEEDHSTRDDIRQRMTDDDRAQWDVIQEWKAAQVNPRSPRVITQRIRSYVLTPVKKVVGLVGKIPGGAAIAGWISSAVLGLVEKATSAAESSVRRERIVKAHRRAGNDVECLEDIRNLNLAEIQLVRPHLKVGYAAVTATEGAVSSVFATGGAVAAILGLGIASAPGIGVIAAAIGLDIATFLASSARLVSHTAAYYGYDKREPTEKLFSAMVLSQAIAPRSSADDHAVEKETSMRIFNKVVRKLTKRGSMESVGNNALTASVNSLFAALGARLVGMKMAQILPLIGIIVGMVLNASLIRTIGVTADHLYRERLLIERYGQDDSAPDHEEADDEDDLDTEVARYIELAKADKRR
jgi:hypothetical protein